MVAPSTGHNTSGLSVSPDACTSIAPNPPTITSSNTCSASERNESSGFGCSRLSVSTRTRAAPSTNSSSDRPRRACTRHFMPAMRSLIVLIAFRATGLSANRRRLAGVGFRIPCDQAVPERGNPNVLRIDGAAAVRRFSLNADNPIASAATASPKDTPAIRRNAPRTFSRMFMISFCVARARMPALCSAGAPARVV